MKAEGRRQKAEARRAEVGLAVLVLLLGVSAGQAQTNLTLDWYSVDGGGGTSTGGVYTVSGTIGQPDAGGTMRGCNATVDGGFWGVIAAVQTPGAPLLSVTLTATNSVIVSWPAPSSCWQLQENGDLTATNWVGVATVPQEVGGRMRVVVWPALGNRFYRLQEP